MDNEFGDKLKQILSDPLAMEKIQSIASSISDNKSVNNGIETVKEAKPSAAVPPSDKRIALLSALKPILSEEKRGKVDALETALTIALLFGNRKKGENQ